MSPTVIKLAIRRLNYKSQFLLLHNTFASRKIMGYQNMIFFGFDLPVDGTIISK
jgi:hypothetical protein